MNPASRSSTLARVSVRVPALAWLLAPALAASLLGRGDWSGGTDLAQRYMVERVGVAAKTGTLRHVNALSGYLRTGHAGELVFSILSNGSGRPAREVRAAVDRIVESLMESGS